MNWGKPPPGYVAGAGRGAVGFTTRSDIGPARAAANAPPGYARTMPKKEEGDYSDAKFDAFSGFSENLFGKSHYDEEDKQADRVFEAIDKHVDSKRKLRREQLEEELEKKYHKKRPHIHQQFAEDKRKLNELSESDWDAIPEAGAQAKRPKVSSRTEKFTPVPDSIIQSSRSAAVGAVDMGGVDTPMTPVVGGTATPSSSIMQLGSARGKVLDMTLGKLSDSVEGQTVVDPKGYLTDMKSVISDNSENISDIKRARQLLSSVTQTNRQHPPGWLAAARLEEHAGKMTKARQVIMEATRACPESEDVWIEAARLHNPREASTILAKAVRHRPTSVKIWIRAAKLERDTTSKKAVLRKALEFIENSIEIWCAAIDLENNENDARIMLSRAVECLPTSVDMWLALASLETYENAKRVLNAARRELPRNHKIWIAAAKLEEAQGNDKMIDKILTTGVKTLTAHGMVIERKVWLEEATNCETAGSPLTCQAIVRATLGIGIDEQDRRHTWRQDADKFEKEGFIHTARAIFSELLLTFPTKSKLWWDAAQLEKKHGTYHQLCTVLSAATKYCKETQGLWLMLAKEKWQHDDLEGARMVLSKAFYANPDSEKISLAAVKLESENGFDARARALLEKARERCDTPRVWMKSAIFERELNNHEMERKLLEAGVRKFPTFAKLWMMLGQLLSASGEHGRARVIYQKAIKHCPQNVPLRLCYAKSEADQGTAVARSKARSILETARLKIRHNEDLWLASIQLERGEDSKLSNRHLATALQECPKSGKLWAYAIDHEIRQKQKSRCTSALKALEDNAYVYLSAAKIFWSNRKAHQTKNWFERAVTADPDLGDAWAFYYAYTLVEGTEKDQQDVLKRCKDAEPRHGDMWIAVSKQVGNLRLKTEEILKLVADNARNPGSSHSFTSRTIASSSLAKEKLRRSSDTNNDRPSSGNERRHHANLEKERRAAGALSAQKEILFLNDPSQGNSENSEMLSKVEVDRSVVEDHLMSVDVDDR